MALNEQTRGSASTNRPGGGANAAPATRAAGSSKLSSRASHNAHARIHRHDAHIEAAKNGVA